MAEFQTIVIYMTDEERSMINTLKEEADLRTQAEVFRETVRRLKAACKDDPKGGTKSLRKAIMSQAEKSKEQNPFANGRPTSVQISKPSVEFMDGFASSVSLDRTDLIRALLRVMAEKGL